MGGDLYQAFYRLESVEYYATILMYTGNVIGRQNILSCSQVNKLLNIRKKIGITSGGVPSCASIETNDKDIVSSGDVRPLEPEACAMKGVTPLVKPGDRASSDGASWAGQRKRSLQR